MLCALESPCHPASWAYATAEAVGHHHSARQSGQKMPVVPAAQAPAARDTVTAPNGIETAVLPGTSAPEATGMPAALQSTPSLTDWRTPIKSAAYRTAELLRWVQSEVLSLLNSTLGSECLMFDDF